MNRQFLTVLIILFVLTLSVTASQQPSDANDLHKLSDYLRYASLNNAELKVKFEQWKAALEQIPQAKALDDPKFTYSYFIEEVETRVGPQQQKLGIMQVFPWFGKIEARTDIAAAKAQAAKQRYETTKLKLFRQVKDAFYEFSYLATATDIAKDNLELLQHFEEVARIKYTTASAIHPDIIRAQVELAKLEDILKSLQQLREPTVAKLNSVLNRPIDAELSWPEKVQPEKFQLDRKLIVQELKRANPELAELSWEIQTQKASVELAKKNFYPDIGIGLDWIQTDGAVAPGIRGSGNDPVILMFSMNIPLWRDKYKAAQQQAKANVRKIQSQRTDTENKLLSKVFEVFYDIENSQRKTHLYGDVLVSKAQELVQASEIAYKAGTIDFLSLIDAQRMLLKYELDYERAVTNHLQKFAELQMLIGTELSSIKNDTTER
ncbi:MAG: TolC family protein [Sedimentisphaerales bacterium]|nr:TolC family protein [Sedimentisphaerales bacterium]